MHYLEYIPEFDNYGIKMSEISDDSLIKLSNKNIKDLNPKAKLKTKIGFLMGLDTSKDGTKYYTIDKDYIKSCLNAGADLIFLDYDNVYSQLRNCNGLILPGGSFDSPKEFYADNIKSTASKRAFAYLKAISYARQHKLPMLGICAGAQMIAASSKRKMFSNINKNIAFANQHKNSSDNAHQIVIFEDSPLFKLLENKHIISVNSRHSECIINDVAQQYFEDSDIQIYALSKPDNIPEAWGNEDKNILCVQFHPENLAVKGHQCMQNIYNWIVEKALEYHIKQAREFKTPLPNNIKSY